jgi:hypothetical protein
LVAVNVDTWIEKYDNAAPSPAEDEGTSSDPEDGREENYQGPDTDFHQS